MDITGYVERLRTDLLAAASVGDEAVGRAAERLAVALDPAARMVLLEALSDAAAEITEALDATLVEIRLKGREPHVVVTATGGAPAFPPPDAPAAPDDDPATARITLRLSDTLKVRAEEAAARSRQSLNTWLVDAIRVATDEREAPPQRRGTGRHLSGWAR